VFVAAVASVTLVVVAKTADRALCIVVAIKREEFRMIESRWLPTFLVVTPSEFFREIHMKVSLRRRVTRFALLARCRLERGMRKRFAGALRG
jgi:hypothetical protein